MKVLEVNVDDMNYGGVYAFVRDVIVHKPEELRIDIAAIEQFQNEDNINFLNSLGTNIHYVGYKKSKLLKQFFCYRNLQSLIKREQYECVHIHSDIAHKLLVSGLAAKKCGVKKIILHSHSSGVEGTGRVCKLFIHRFCRRMLKYIGTDFVACSKTAGAWMFPNVKKNDITIIHNGIDLKRFQFHEAIRDKMRDELNIEKNQIVVGHVGRFSYAKNHEYIMRIAKCMREKKINFKILLIGEGEEKCRIKKMAADMGIEKNIIFYGITDTVETLYCAMDIFILPSRFEGYPIVSVEAQASGLPVILSRSITEEVKLTESVDYMGIAPQDIENWIGVIIKSCHGNRLDSYTKLKQNRCDIEDTVQQLYQVFVGNK